jgi:hypothetical protein
MTRGHKLPKALSQKEPQADMRLEAAELLPLGFWAGRRGVGGRSADLTDGTL